MNIVSQLESQHSKSAIPALRAGETVRVHVKVVEIGRASCRERV